MSEFTLSPAQFQQALKRFLHLLDDTLYRFENAGQFTSDDDILVHGDELRELAWSIGNTHEPWFEGGTDRPGYTRLDIRDPETGLPPEHDPVSGKFLCVYLTTPVGDTDPADRERFVKLLRLWRNYIVGLQTSIGVDTTDAVLQATDDPTEHGFTVAALKDMAGLGNTALSGYAKAAEVATPGVGKSNFRYPKSDAVKILKHILAAATDTQVREKCRASLQSLIGNH